MNGTLSRRHFIQGTAIGVGAAATLGPSSVSAQCPVNPTKFAFETAPAPISARSISTTLSADVVVVGGGIAGLIAALSAAESGASVHLIEKGHTFSARGGDNTAINSRLHETLGIQIDKDRIIHDLMKVCGGRLDHRVLSVWAQNSGRVMNWLMDMVEAEGLKNYLVIPTRTDEDTLVIDRWPNPTRTPAGWNWQEEYTVEYPTCHRLGSTSASQRTWLAIVEKNARAKGVTTSYRMKAVRLVREADRVKAVIGQDEAGRYVRLNATRGVILSTGDYSNHPDMVAKYFPGAGLKLGEIPSSMGEGHQMAMWIGAVMENTPHAPLNDVTHALGTDAFLLVNRLGQRFCNEDLDSEARARQAEEQGGCWMVVDSTWPDDVPHMGLGFYRVFEATPAVRREFQEKVDAGRVVQAATLDELAGKMRVPATALKATIARYNELAKGGRDLDFGKRADRVTAVDTPPFFAHWTALPDRPMLIFGGLLSDARFQALDAKGQTIPGLYLAGNTVGGRFKHAYPLLCPGISHGMAATTGYLAGKNVMG